MFQIPDFHSTDSLSAGYQGEPQHQQLSTDHLGPIPVRPPSASAPSQAPPPLGHQQTAQSLAQSAAVSTLT